jgi:hypothetical protein
MAATSNGTFYRGLFFSLLLGSFLGTAGWLYTGQRALADGLEKKADKVDVDKKVNREELAGELKAVTAALEGVQRELKILNDLHPRTNAQGRGR